MSETNTLASSLSPNFKRIQALCGGSESEARELIAAFTACADANPLLYECSPKSLRNAALMAAQVGILPATGAKAKAYIVPRKGKGGEWEANYTVSAWGFFQLVLQSGFLKDAWWDSVYEGDEFQEIKGLHRNLKHKPGPNYDGDPKQITHVYVCYETIHGGRGFRVFPRSRIERYRLMNPAEKKGAFSPWQEFYREMAEAKAARHTFDALPSSKEMQLALAADDAATTGDSAYIAPYIDAEFRDQEPKEKGVDALKAKIAPVDPVEAAFQQALEETQ